MAQPRTYVDVATDSRTWGWTMPDVLQMTRESAMAWYQQLCQTLRSESERIEAAYLGAEAGDFPEAQRKMAECFDTGDALAADPTVLALAAAALDQETLQWIRMFWALHGPKTTVEAVRQSLRLAWRRDGDISCARTGDVREPSRSEADFLRGLLNTLPDSDLGRIRTEFEPWFDAAEGAELRFCIQLFPDPSWVERLRARSTDDPRAWALAASMIPSHHDAQSHLIAHQPLDRTDVPVIVVNLLKSHGHGKTMRLIEELLGAQPDLVAELIPVFDDTVTSVAACVIALRDIEAGRGYLTERPQHALAALEQLEAPTDRQDALMRELRALPSPSETAETVSYWPLGWDVEGEDVVASGPGAFGSWDDVTINVRVHPDLLPQLDESDPIAALDLLQPNQRDTLQFVVSQWATIAMVAGTVLEDNAATPSHIVIRADDDALEYGIAARSDSHAEHGLGIRMKALAVANVGGMAEVV